MRCLLIKQETLLLQIKYSAKLSQSNLSQQSAPMAWLWLIRKLRRHCRIKVKFEINRVETYRTAEGSIWSLMFLALYKISFPLRVILFAKFFCGFLNRRTVRIEHIYPCRCLFANLTNPTIVEEWKTYFRWS